MIYIDRPYRLAARALLYKPWLIPILAWGFVLSFVSLPVMLSDIDTGAPRGYEQQWTSSASNDASEMGAWMTYRNDDPWEQEFITVIVQGKQDKEGSDMATQETLAKLEEVLALWFDLNVTIKSGRFFTIWDLCSRGPAVPDFPQQLFGQASNHLSGPLYLPCMSVSLLNCFREQSRFLHRESYFKLDSDPSMLEFMLGGSAKPYSTRQSYIGKTPNEIKAIIMNASIDPVGCPWYSDNVTFPLFTTLLGDAEHSNGFLTKAPYLFTTHFYDGPRRMAFRKLGASFPESLPGSLEQELDEFREARRVHMEQFYTSVKGFSDRSPDIEFVVLMPIDEEVTRIHANNKRVPWFLLAATAFIQFVPPFAFWNLDSPTKSHCNSMSLGAAINLCAIMSAYGLYLTCGFHYNTLLIFVVPCLLLSLGMDDVIMFGFVLSELDELDDTITDYMAPNRIFEEFIFRAGLPITIKFVIESVCAGVGCFIPVPAVRDSCILVVISSIMQYISMAFVISVLAYLEILRARYSLPEPACVCCNTGCCCGCVPSRFPCSAHYKEKPRAKRRRPCITFCGQQLLRFQVHASISIFALVFCLLGILSNIFHQTIELQIHTLTEGGSYTSQAFDHFSKHYGNFQHYLVFWDVDVPSYQKDMLELYDAVTQLDDSSPDIFPAFLSNFYTTWGSTVDGFFNTSSWKHSALAPLGIASKDPGEFYSNYLLWNTPVLSNDSLFGDLAISSTYIHGPFANSTCWSGSNYLASLVYNCDNSSRSARPFVIADLSGTNEFSYNHQKLRLSFMRFWTQLATAEPEQISYKVWVQHVQELLSKYNVFSSSQVFVKGILYDSVVATMEANTSFYRQVLPISILMAFICMTLMLVSVTYGLVITLAYTMILVETSGLILCFQPFTSELALSLVIGAGLAVNSVVYFVVCFLITEKDGVEDRLLATLQTVVPRCIVTSLSTLVSLVPVAFSTSHKTFSYFCIPFGFMSTFSLAHGLIILPSIVLALHRINRTIFQSKSGEVTV